MGIEDTHDTARDVSESEKNPMEKLEDALVTCKFGRFHVKLMIITLIAVAATTSVTSTTSYILPSAECDLDMNMMQKGLLNGIPFFGQICVSLFTGFLVDAFGRKVFLVSGNFAMFLFGVLGASSQTYWMLLIAKMFEGISMSFSFTATTSMVSEFTHKNVRDRVLLLYSSSMSVSLIIVALLAWGILPLPFHIVLIKDQFELRSWNIYLYASSLWSLMAGILYWLLPESPKFLLSHGRENEALEVLKDIYHTNTRKEKETFPITSLNVSGVYKSTVNESIRKRLTNALFEVKSVFKCSLVIRLLLFCITTFVCLLSYSALRLWYPQLSTIIENYQVEHQTNNVQFCAVIQDYNFRNINITDIDSSSLGIETCVPQLAGTETYINLIILGIGSFLSIGLSAFLVNYFGPKPLMFVFLVLCAVCSSSLYWTNSSLQIAILVSVTVGFMQTAFSLQQNIIVRVFPTTVRTIALSMVMLTGRVGSLLGNIIFPVMLQMGCMAPFLMLSAVTLCVAGLVYFLPNPNKENNGTGEK